MQRDFVEVLDPELAAAMAALPEGDPTDWDDLPAIRAQAEQEVEQWLATVPDLPGVAKEDRTVPGSDPETGVPIRIYRPAGATGTLPCLLYIHGGGMVFGSVAGADPDVQSLVEAVGCVAVSVEYRLAPEYPFPAPLEDCYAALRWVWEHRGEIGVDVGRLAVGGASAGGGLAAGLALLVRDRAAIQVSFQWLIYPMLDDRNITPSSHAITDPRVWNRDANLRGWRAYLGAEPGSDGVSYHASPARATDLSGLPPAYVQVGSQDLFLDEDAMYAQRLAGAGVPVELHVYPGVFHGSEGAAPEAAVSRRMIADRLAAVQRGLFPK
jgi:acetyl esterase/lipase